MFASLTNILLFYVWKLCLHVTEYVLCSAQRRQKVVSNSWNWSYGRLLATTWGLEFQPGSSLRVASTLNHWTITPALNVQFLILGPFYKMTVRDDYQEGYWRTQNTPLLNIWKSLRNPMLNSTKIFSFPEFV